jgi:hypothetical protein
VGDYRNSQSFPDGRHVPREPLISRLSMAASHLLKQPCILIATHEIDLCTREYCSTSYASWTTLLTCSGPVFLGSFRNSNSKPVLWGRPQMAFWVKVIGLRIVSTWSWAFMCESWLPLLDRKGLHRGLCHVWTFWRKRYALWC